MTTKKYRRRPLRHTGQHFLRDDKLIRQIIARAHINRNHLVLDIGAGKGALTEPLSRNAGRVIAMEKDPRLISHLKRSFAKQAHVTVAGGDARELHLPGKPFKVISSIPYMITTDLFGKLMDRPETAFRGGLIIIEWGAAKRFAKTCSRNPRVVGWNTWFELDLILRVKPTSFSPQPGVDSAVVEIRRRKRPVVKPEHFYRYLSFVATLLEHPDLSAPRVLRSLFTRNQVKRIMADTGIKSHTRVSHLEVSQWGHCFNTMNQLIPKQVHPAMPGKYKRFYK